MPDNDSIPNNPQGQKSDNWLKEAADWWSQALSDAGAGFRARLDAEARKPRKPVEPEPFNDFDRHFFALVQPKLEGYVHLGAHMVGQGLETFSDAHNRVMNAARKYGATHLSEAAFWAFDAWIDTSILAMIDKPGPDGVITVERLREITGEGK